MQNGNGWQSGARHIALGLLCGLLSSCGESATSPTSVEPVGESPAVGTAGGRVAWIRSALGHKSGLFALTDGAKRALSVEGIVAWGEGIQTEDGVEAQLVFEDGTAVFVDEKSIIKVDKMESRPLLELIEGRLTVIRPFTASTPFFLSALDQRFISKTGRLIVRIDGAGHLYASTISGASVLPDGRTLNPGEEVILNPRGALTRPRPMDYRGSIPMVARAATTSGLSVEAPVLASPRVTPLRGIGTLTARVPGSGRRSETALELVSHQVEATLTDGVAVTRIEEVFANHSPRTVEGTYRFVLPAGASIARVALEVNGQLVEGEVLEKKRARRIFKQIVTDAVTPRDPLLLEWIDGSSFRMKIFPILAGERRRVVLTYLETHTAVNGRYRYVYPLGGSMDGPAAGRFSFHATVDSPLEPTDLRTPLFPCEVSGTAERTEVRFTADRFRPSADLVVDYGTRRDPGPIRCTQQVQKNGQAHLLCLLRPAFDRALVEPGPRRVVFVVDTSYSLSANARELVDRAVLETVASLSAQDSFALLACDSGCRAAVEGFVHPSQQAIRRIHGFLREHPPGGASDLLGALTSAAELARDGRPTDVVYFGDGIPTAGVLDPQELVGLLSQILPPKVVVHTVGIGPSVDQLVLNALAGTLGGGSLRLALGQPPAAVALAVAQHLYLPSLTRVRFTLPPGMILADPRAVGFVPLGSEVPLLASLERRPPAGDVVLYGELGGSPVEQRFSISPGVIRKSTSGYASRLWAKQRIDALTFVGAPPNQIVTLSRTSRVMSRYTSWIVLENEQMFRRFNIQRTDPQVSSIEDPLDDAEAEPAELGELAFDFDDQVAAPAAPTASRSAPAPSPRKKAQPAMARKAKADTSLLDLMGSGAGSGGVAGSPISQIATMPPRPRFDVRIQKPRGVTNAAQKRLARSAAAVAAQPLSRHAHRRYLGMLARMDRLDEAMAAAQAWHDRDPFNRAAITFLADQYARGGRRMTAVRLYAANAELSPKRSRFHRWIGQTLLEMGDFGGAAGHFRAAATTGKQGEDWLDYLQALFAARRNRLAVLEGNRLLAAPPSRSLRKRIQRLLDAATTGVLPSMGSKDNPGRLKVRLQLDRPDVDLDLAIIDPAGRRISGLWRRWAVGRGLTEGGRESLTLGSLINGRYRIAVSRNEHTPPGPLAGRVTIVCRGKRKTLPFTLTGSDAVVAELVHRKLPSNR